MLFCAYEWRMLKSRFLGPSFLVLSAFLVGQEFIFFLILKSCPCYKSGCLPQRELATSQQHSQADKKPLQIKAEAVAERPLHVSKNSYLFVQVQLSYRSSSLWYSSQMPRSVINCSQDLLNWWHWDHLPKNYVFSLFFPLG